jgi:hypothetical protein
MLVYIALQQRQGACSISQHHMRAQKCCSNPCNSCARAQLQNLPAS